ncbi:MAG TPA: hypothetical protein VKB86_04785 [Pyrinomonadaceae bacterium]|nr:hypothetical protein [Pyrinomonadaceae bacterium]
MRKPIVKLSLRFLALGILTGCLWFFYNDSGFSQSIPLRVVVAQQPDSPILVFSTYVDQSDPLRPRYGYTVTNASDKPIRAYTIQESVSRGGGGPIVGISLTNLPAVKLFLKPNETKQEEGGVGRVYQSPPDKVELAVDFVEFADGTRWGNDTSKSGERLDGFRAGGKAAIKKYREILVTDGAKGLEQALEDTNLIQPEGQSKSSVWADGFNSGVSIVKSRLSAAKTKGGQDEIKRELEKPFDSTEGRQEP